MAIDARVRAVSQQQDGTAVLHLEGRHKGDHPGQSALVVLNPPPTGLDAMVGIELWGSDGWIMVRDRIFAERVGPTRIRLRGKTDGKPPEPR